MRDLFTYTTLTDKQKLSAFALMCVGMFLALLDIQTVSLSHVSATTGDAVGIRNTFARMAYIFSQILILPLSARVAPIVSTKLLFCVTAIGFAIVSILRDTAIGLAGGFVFDILHNAFGGALVAIVITTALIFFPGPKIIMAALAISAVYLLAPAIGPAVGGWITVTFKWHWLLLVNLIPGTAVATCATLLLNTGNAKLFLLRTMDYRRLMASAIFLGAMDLALELVPSWKWLQSDTSSITAWVSALCCVAFVELICLGDGRRFKFLNKTRKLQRKASSSRPFVSSPVQSHEKNDDDA